MVPRHSCRTLPRLKNERLLCTFCSYVLTDRNSTSAVSSNLKTLFVSFWGVWREIFFPLLQAVSHGCLISSERHFVCACNRLFAWFPYHVLYPFLFPLTHKMLRLSVNSVFLTFSLFPTPHPLTRNFSHTNASVLCSCSFTPTAYLLWRIYLLHVVCVCQMSVESDG